MVVSAPLALTAAMLAVISPVRPLRMSLPLPSRGVVGRALSADTTGAGSESGGGGLRAGDGGGAGGVAGGGGAAAAARMGCRAANPAIPQKAVNATAPRRGGNTGGPLPRLDWRRSGCGPLE